MFPRIYVRNEKHPHWESKMLEGVKNTWVLKEWHWEEYRDEGASYLNRPV